MKKKVFKTKKPPLMQGGKIKKDKYNQAWTKEQSDRRKKEQGDCPHIAGSNPLSELPDLFNRSSIIWHRFNDGIIRGICTNCQRPFVPEDKDYELWLKHKSINTLSEAKLTTGTNGSGCRLVRPDTELEYLSNEQISDLFEKMRIEKAISIYPRKPIQKMDTE